MNTTLDIAPEQLQAIILSHGWFSLKPFLADVNPPRLIVSFALSDGMGAFEVSAKDGHCELKAIVGDVDRCLDIAENCLSLDVFPEVLYELAGKNWGWLYQNNMGRFLRSPTLFEDCCKVICSTNTTWERTESMVENMVSKFGAQVGQHIAFPDPKTILTLGEAALKAETGCGFRARYIIGVSELALSEQDVFMGKGWQPLDNDAFYERLITIKGIGPASANYLSLVYWKPNGFNIDSYVTRRCAEIWGIEESGILPFLTNRYKGFGAYAPLVFWFDITKHWHVSDVNVSAMSW